MWGMKVSPGTISSLNKKAYEHIEIWRTRPLSGDYPYVSVDSVYLKRSWGARRYMNMDHLFKAEDDLLSDIIAG